MSDAKACNACGKTKLLTEFYARKASRDGYQGHCKQCSNAKTAKIRAANRDYMRDYMRTDAGRASQRRHRLKAHYGLTEAEWDALILSQDNRCACCGREEPGGKGSWHVDHDHDTGRIRGLLCHNCNVGIGNLGDSLEGVSKAVAYLEKHYNV